MEETQTVPGSNITKAFTSPSNPKKLLLMVVGVSILLGAITGFVLSQKGGGANLAGANLLPAKNPAADTRTFKDFAEGTLKAKPAPEEGEYAEGTHTLTREGAVPVALTSSVVDLSKYEGKKVKVYGETQKALSEGWLMDVGKVEEIK